VLRAPARPYCENEQYPKSAKPMGVRFFLILLGSAAYFALSIYGKGGFSAFFSKPSLLALAIVFLIIVVFAGFAGGGITSGKEEDRSNRWVIVAFSIIGLAIGFVPAYTDRINFLTFGGDPVRWLGVALFGIGGALRIWPVYVLGNRFSGLVAIQPSHQLMTSGIYGVIRHPSYAGLLINSVGWSLAFRSGAGLFLTALLVPVLLSRIQSEEALLSSYFGMEYETYRSRTWRLIPGVY
jgi:protein-S-isoprenylcysteine O-methyltransferase Ste14